MNAFLPSDMLSRHLCRKSVHVIAARELRPEETVLQYNKNSIISFSKVDNSIGPDNECKGGGFKSWFKAEAYLTTLQLQ